LFLEDSRELASCQVNGLDGAKNAGISWLSESSSISDVLDYLSPHIVMRGSHQQ
jgi:hypothetical protein